MKKLGCILLIDDDAPTNVYHRIIIEEGNFTDKIIVKTNGEEALEYLKSPFSDSHPRPDLVFLDINMPRMNGWEFLEAYRQLDEHQKALNVIVMLSTSAHYSDLERAEKNPDIKEYRGKPLNEDMLEEIISRYWPEGMTI
ncbi:MAG: response regulator [Bacteroidota bacterium]